MSARPQLDLLGAGLDAIVQRRLPELSIEDAIVQHQRHVPAVSPRQRLARYQRALAANPGHQLELRQQIGAGFQAAWRRGRWPQLAAFARVMARIAQAARS